MIDKMKLISEYLSSLDEEFFDKNFSEKYDIVIWVDSREEDDAIVEYCENILATGKLRYKILKSTNERGFDLVITYKDVDTIVPYKVASADRDTTIITLNEIIQPEYEIRFFKESDHTDTLAFLPLASKEWKRLDGKYGKEVKNKFSKITKDSSFFG